MQMLPLRAFGGQSGGPSICLRRSPTAFWYPRGSSQGPRWGDDRVGVLQDGKCILGSMWDLDCCEYSRPFLRRARNL